MSFEQKFINLLRANINVIQIISYETLRIHAMLVRAAGELKRTLYIWNRIEGLKEWNNEKRTFEIKNEEMRNSSDIFDFLKETKDVIVLLEDFHPDLSENNPETTRRIRNFSLEGEKTKNLILSQPYKSLPVELEKEVHIVELPYPRHQKLIATYKKVCEKYEIPNAEPSNELIEAALGLTTMEAERAFSIAYIENGRLTKAEVPLILKEKENVIKKSGYLEYYHPKEELKDVGGIDNLKSWLIKRGKGFDKDAKSRGLTYPRGILLLGIPGTGKSLTAKAIGNLWNFPLLKLDMGKVFGGIVGQSESNIRGALNIAEAIAPSVLWIDEIEKAMSGISSSGNTDGGTTARVLGTFLTWMQEKEKPVFVVATANDISQLPPELLRKGRVDEIFFVDLPTEKEREEIIKIHLSKTPFESKNFNLNELAKASTGFSGAELEEAVKEAMFNAYDDNKRDVNDKDILNAIGKTFPISQTMREQIAKMRLWAKSRAVLASSGTPEQMIDNGKNIPHLKQETYNNPFL